MIYTRKHLEQIAILYRFSSLSLAFSRSIIYGLERKQIIFFFSWQKSKQNLFFGNTIFFRRKLEKHGFLHCFFAKQTREITEISSLQIELLQFFWSEENSFCRNFSGPETNQFLVILPIERNWFT